MIDMMESVKAEMTSLKVATTAATAELMSQVKKVKEDVQRLESNVDILTAEHNETRDGLVSLRTEVAQMKDFMGSSSAAAQVGPCPSVSAAHRASSVGAPNSFVPCKVFVQGFFDFATGQGALKAAQRDQLAKSFLDGVPADLSSRFTVETRYSLTRRLVFIAKDGGEICWTLREKFMDVIERKVVVLEEKQVKVRVEEALERQVKRANFWRAVDALKSMVGEDDFIKEPATFSLHDSKQCLSLGQADETGFHWNEKRMKDCFPDLSLTDLRKACLKRIS